MGPPGSGASAMYIQYVYMDVTVPTHASPYNFFTLIFFSLTPVDSLLAVTDNRATLFAGQ